MGSELHYLYLCASGLSGLRHNDNDNGLEPSASFFPNFEQDDQGVSTHAALASWLKDYLADTFVLIVDSGEEEFSIELVPKMGRKDEAAVIKRRLAQKFREARLSQWNAIRSKKRKLLSLKKDPAAQVRVLMSGVAKDSALTSWLTTIERSKVAVRSVVSPALLAQRVSHHRLKDKTAMIVSWCPAGLRQTVLLDGEVRFTRLAGKLTAPDIASVQMECLRTIQYLLMSQQVSRDLLRSTGMPIWIIEGGITGLDQLPDHLTVDSSVDVPLGLVPSRVSGAKLSPEFGALPAWCEAEGFAPIAGSTRFAYADTALRQGYVVRLLQRWLIHTGTAALVCAALSLACSFGLKILWSVESQSAGTQTLQAQAQQQSLALDLAKFSVPGPEMHAVVNVAENLSKRHVEPIGMLQHVANALEPITGLELSILRWKRIETGQSQAWASLDLTGKPGGGDADEKGGPNGGKSVSTGTLAALTNSGPLGESPASVKKVDGQNASFGQAPLGASPAVPAAGAAGGSSSVQSELLLGPVVLEIQGQVTGQPRMQEANEQVNLLAERLSASCGCEVMVSKLPFDPAAISGFNKSFEGQEEGGKALPGFSLRAMWREASDGAIASKLSTAAPKFKTAATVSE